MEIQITENEIIQVQGPSKIEVVKGEIEIFGKKIHQSQSLIVQKGKSFPIEASEPSILRINTESPDNVKTLEGQILSDQIKELAKEILNLPKPCKILLLGGTDTGKTSTITYLANYCFENGYKVAVLDLDVGQHDIGPPCTIGLGILKESIYHIQEIPVHSLYFIGNTSPSGHLLRCLIGINKLLENANQVDVILFDTTGWIYGAAARSYKIAKIEFINPDLIVALQRENEIEHLLKPFYDTMPVHRLIASENVSPRSNTDRRFLREVAFRNYFSNAQFITLNNDKIGFSYSLYKSGIISDEKTLNSIEKILGLKAKYCEISKDGIFFVQYEPEKYWKVDNLNILKEEFGVLHIHIVKEGDEKGILVGMVGNKEHLGIGIIDEIDYNKNTTKIFTPISKEKIKIIQFGSIKINQSGVELEKIRPFF